ncbi:hypothetical protein BU16DRAFT_560071 [Lophium mytilinum]|uniref:Uncharacterized protein n=1 Tax=Lophium mytilinum TaxID=390894 RepID=A0A6A6QX77_9PEZI|nr:hypothetical protein BU16DRAFT_560071 [Lophium mytilinum]
MRVPRSTPTGAPFASSRANDTAACRAWNVWMLAGRWPLYPLRDRLDSDYSSKWLPNQIVPRALRDGVKTAASARDASWSPLLVGTDKVQSLVKNCSSNGHYSAHHSQGLTSQAALHLRRICISIRSCMLLEIGSPASLHETIPCVEWTTLPLCIRAVFWRLRGPAAQHHVRDRRMPPRDALAAAGALTAALAAELYPF